MDFFIRLFVLLPQMHARTRTFSRAMLLIDWFLYLFVLLPDARKNTDLKGKLNIAKWDAKENVSQ